MNGPGPYELTRLEGHARCACGLPLHYSDIEVRRMVERMIDLAGGDQYVTVATLGVPPRAWRVQRHYIALHGLKGVELPAIAAALGFEEIILDADQTNPPGRIGEA